MTQHWMQPQSCKGSIDEKALSLVKAREFKDSNTKKEKMKAKRKARRNAPLASRTFCNHFVKKKNRYCCMARTPGTLFCGMHQDPSVDYIAAAEDTLADAIVELTENEKLNLSKLDRKNAFDLKILSLASSTPKLVRVPPYLYVPRYNIYNTLALNLLDLDLSCNELTKIPAAIGNFKNLTSLNISRNFLRRLPMTLGQLKKLETINASSNSFRSIATLSLDAISTLHTPKKTPKKTTLTNVVENDFTSNQTDIQNSNVLNTKVNTKGCTALRHFDLRFIVKIGEIGKNHLAEIKKSLGPLVSVLITARLPDVEKHHAADRDATLLLSQFTPHCTGILRRRLALCFGETTNPEEVKRDELIRRLLDHYRKEDLMDANGVAQRQVRRISGTPVSKNVCDKLLCEMKKWVEKDIQRRKRPGELRERTNIRASHYMILSSPKAFTTTRTATENLQRSCYTTQNTPITVIPPINTKSELVSSLKMDSCLSPVENNEEISKKAQRAALKLAKYPELWELARQALLEVDPVFAREYTAVAFTKNFVGSPHIDTQNTGPFYGLALGDFKAPGGKLCVECSAREIAEVDTRERLGHVDGRFPHWVKNYTGDRYSVIFYKTSAGNVVPRTTAVFSGESLAPEDAPTFPLHADDSYYKCYDFESNTYSPTT